MTNFDELTSQAKRLIKNSPDNHTSGIRNELQSLSAHAAFGVDLSRTDQLGKILIAGFNHPQTRIRRSSSQVIFHTVSTTNETILRSGGNGILGHRTLVALESRFNIEKDPITSMYLHSSISQLQRLEGIKTKNYYSTEITKLLNDNSIKLPNFISKLDQLVKHGVDISTTNGITDKLLAGLKSRDIGVRSTTVMLIHMALDMASDQTLRRSGNSILSSSFVKSLDVALQNQTDVNVLKDLMALRARFSRIAPKTQTSEASVLPDANSSTSSSPVLIATAYDDLGMESLRKLYESHPNKADWIKSVIDTHVDGNKNGSLIRVVSGLEDLVTLIDEHPNHTTFIKEIIAKQIALVENGDMIRIASGLKTLISVLEANPKQSEFIKDITNRQIALVENGDMIRIASGMEELAIILDAYPALSGWTKKISQMQVENVISGDMIRVASGLETLIPIIAANLPLKAEIENIVEKQIQIRDVSSSDMIRTASGIACLVGLIRTFPEKKGILLNQTYRKQKSGEDMICSVWETARANCFVDTPWKYEKQTGALSYDVKDSNYSMTGGGDQSLTEAIFSLQASSFNALRETFKEHTSSIMTTDKLPTDKEGREKLKHTYREMISALESLSSNIEFYSHDDTQHELVGTIKWELQTCVNPILRNFIELLDQLPEDLNSKKKAPKNTSQQITESNSKYNELFIELDGHIQNVEKNLNALKTQQPSIV